MFVRECVLAIDGILSSFDVFSVFRLCSVACVEPSFRRILFAENTFEFRFRNVLVCYGCVAWFSETCIAKLMSLFVLLESCCENEMLYVYTLYKLLQMMPKH